MKQILIGGVSGAIRRRVRFILVQA